MNELTKQQIFSNNLRNLAAWYDEHPTVPTPTFGIDFTVSEFSAKPEEIRAIGPGKKEYSDQFFYYVVEGEGFKLKFFEYRNLVCTKKVVGKKVVPAIPEHEVEIVEWECPGSLLASDEVAA